MQPVGTDAAAQPSFAAVPVATAAPVTSSSGAGQDRRRSSSGAVGGQQAVGWEQASVAHRRSQSGQGPAAVAQYPKFARPGGVRTSPPHHSLTTSSSAVFPARQASRPSSVSTATVPPFSSAQFVAAAVNRVPQQAGSIPFGASSPHTSVDPRLYTLDIVEQCREVYIGVLQTLFERGGGAIVIALQDDVMRCLSEVKLPIVQSMLAEFAPEMMVIHGCRPKDYLSVFEEYKDWSHKRGIPTFPLTGATAVYFLIDRISRLDDRIRVVQILELYRAATINVFLTLGGRPRASFGLGWTDSDWASWLLFVEQAEIRVHEWLSVREACGISTSRPAPSSALVSYYAPPANPVVHQYPKMTSSAPGPAQAPPQLPMTHVPSSAQATPYVAARPGPLARHQSRQSQPSHSPTPTASSLAQFQPPTSPRSNSFPSRGLLPLSAPALAPSDPAVLAHSSQPLPIMPHPSAYSQSVQPYQPYRTDAPNASTRPAQPNLHRQTSRTHSVPIPPVLAPQSAGPATPSASPTAQRRPAPSAAIPAVTDSPRLSQEFPPETQHPVDQHRNQQPASRYHSTAPLTHPVDAPHAALPSVSSHAPRPSLSVTVAHQSAKGEGDGGQVDLAAQAMVASGPPGGEPDNSPFVERLKLPTSAPLPSVTVPLSTASLARPAAFSAAPLASLAPTPTAAASASQPVPSTSTTALAVTAAPAMAACAVSAQQPMPAPSLPPSTFSFPASVTLEPADFVDVVERPRKKRCRRRKGPFLPPEEEAEEEEFYAAVDGMQSAITLYRHEREAVAVAVALQKTAHTRVSPWRNGTPDVAATASLASLDLETPFGDYIPPTISDSAMSRTCIVTVPTSRDPLNALLPFPGNPPPPVRAKITRQPFARLSQPEDAFSLAPQPFLIYPNSLRPPDEGKRAQLWDWALGLGAAAKRFVEEEAARTRRVLDDDELERAKKAQLGVMVREAVQRALMESLPKVKEPKLARKTRRTLKSIALTGARSGKRKESVVLDLVDEQDAHGDGAAVTKPSEIALHPADAAASATSAAPVRPLSSAGTASTPALPTVWPRAGSTGAMRRRASVSGVGIHPLAQYYAQAPGAMRQQLRDMSADIRGVPSDSTAGALAHATSRMPALRPNGLSVASPRIGFSKSPALASPPLVPMPLDEVDGAGSNVMQGSGSARQETVEPPVPSGSTALGVIVGSPADASTGSIDKSTTSATAIEGGAAAVVTSAVASAVGSVLRATVGAVSAAAKAVVPGALVGKLDGVAPTKSANGEDDDAQDRPASRSATPVNAPGKRHRRCKICASAECPGRWRRDLCTAASRATSGERRLDKGKGKADGAVEVDGRPGGKTRIVAARMYPCSVRNMRVDWLRVSEPVRPFGPFP